MPDREIPIANASEVEYHYDEDGSRKGGGGGLYRMWFGAYGTKLYVWADSFESAFEEGVEWLDDNAPGNLTDLDEGDLRSAADEIGVTWQDSWPDWDDADFQRVIEKAEEDLTLIGHTTLKHGRYIPSHEWGGDDVTDPDEIRDVVERSYDEIFGEEEATSASEGGGDDPRFDEALTRFIEGAQAMLDEHYQQNYPQLWEMEHTVLTPQYGPRYVRVVRANIRRDTGGNPLSGSVYTFVDRRNGDILKPAGWKGPAKHARGNIYDADPLRAVGAYGTARLREGAAESDDRAVISEAQDIFGDGGRRRVGLRHWGDGTIRLAFIDAFQGNESFGKGSTSEEALEDAKARGGALYKRRIVFRPGASKALLRVMDALQTEYGGGTVEGDDSTREQPTLHTLAPFQAIDSYVRIARARKDVVEVVEV